MNYVNDNDGFLFALAVWRGKGRPLDGVQFITLSPGCYQIAVIEYDNDGIAYTNTAGPYASWRRAHAVLGAQLDLVEAVYSDQ